MSKRVFSVPCRFRTRIDGSAIVGVAEPSGASTLPGRHDISRSGLPHVREGAVGAADASRPNAAETRLSTVPGG